MRILTKEEQIAQHYREECNLYRYVIGGLIALGAVAITGAGLGARWGTITLAAGVVGAVFAYWRKMPEKKRLETIIAAMCAPSGLLMALTFAWAMAVGVVGLFK